MRVEQPDDLVTARHLAATGLQPRKLLLWGDCSREIAAAMSALMASQPMNKMLQRVELIVFHGKKHPQVRPLLLSTCQYWPASWLPFAMAAATGCPLFIYHLPLLLAAAAPLPFLILRPLQEACLKTWSALTYGSGVAVNA
jgi:hypothetical protein